MAKKSVIDYDAFRRGLIEGLRKAWDEVRRKRPKESFFTFGIETDSDITDLNPICKSDEQFETEAAASEHPVSKWDMTADLCRAGAKHTKALAQQVNRYVFEDHGKDAEGERLERKRRLLRVFEDALVQLDAEEFFGAAKKRTKILLQISFVDPSDAEWRHMLKVIKRINPPKSSAKFFADLKAAEQSYENDHRAKQTAEEPIRELAIAFLRREKRPVDRCLNVHRLATITPFLLGILDEPTPAQEIWEVCFEAKGEKSGRLHGPGILLILVNPETGKCVIAP